MPSASQLRRLGLLASKEEEAAEDRKQRPHRRLIVGLGNDTSLLAHTRHNVGFMAIDSLQDAPCLPPIEFVKDKAVVRSRVFRDCIVHARMCAAAFALTHLLCYVCTLLE